MHALNKYIITGITAENRRVGRAEGERELVQTARGEREFGVDEDRGGRETAKGDRELGGESQLEAYLSLAATALGDELGY